MISTKWFFGAVSLLLLLAVPAHAQNSSYSVEIVGPNSQAGFNYSYILRVPKEPLSRHHKFLVVESNNTGPNDSYAEHLKLAKSFVEGMGIGPNIASKLNVPLLVPVFPRTKSEWQYYTHALDKDTMLIESGPSKRLDLQLLRMVEDAQARLKNGGYEVNAKFALVGFSASGTFSNRFAFLHPARLLAVVSGAVNSFPMLPASEMEGHELEYPLGTANLVRFTRDGFDIEAWKKLPQKIFMGANDTNDAVKFDDGYSKEEREIVFAVVGEDMTKRWMKAQAIYLAKQPNVSFSTYGQIGHGTDGLINGAIVNFIDIAMRRATAAGQAK